MLFSNLALTLQAEEIFIPPQFQVGQPIEQVILICDVDGVIREGVEAIADARVLAAIKSLLENAHVEVTFISGTPIAHHPDLQPWQGGNRPLNQVFDSAFKKELREDRVAIYGVLGGHRMKEDGSLQVVDEYPLEVSFELTHLLLQAFLKEVIENGLPHQQSLAEHLQLELDKIQLHDLNQATNVTAKEFQQMACTIREHLDPEFRLTNNGALVETHTSNPPWNTSESFKWLQQEMEQPSRLTSLLDPSQKQMATGFAKRGGRGFNYLLISKTNKGITIQKHIEEKLKKLPRALIITIGDTQVDFPMHQHAHLAFHVGLEQVLRAHALPQCMLVRNFQGEDKQHVEGTLQVLALLKEAIGKSFDDFRYIPKQDASGKWDYYSLRDMQK